MLDAKYISKKLKKKNKSVNKMSLLNVYSMIFIYFIALHLKGLFVLDFYILCVGHLCIFVLKYCFLLGFDQLLPYPEI